MLLRQGRRTSTLLEKALEHNSVVFKALVADTFLLLKGPFYPTFFARELFVLFFLFETERALERTIQN